MVLYAIYDSVQNQIIALLPSLLLVMQLKPKLDDNKDPMAGIMDLMKVCSLGALLFMDTAVKCQSW